MPTAVHLEANFQLVHWAHGSCGRVSCSDTLRGKKMGVILCEHGFFGESLPNYSSSRNRHCPLSIPPEDNHNVVWLIHRLTTVSIQIPDLNHLATPI